MTHQRAPHFHLTLLLAAAALAACGGSPEGVPPRGDSREFQSEVGDVHERNQALHEKGQELQESLEPLERKAAALRDELAALSAQWAHDTHRELDEALERASRTLADFRAATGADWENLGREAEEAIEDLEDIHERARRDVDARRGGGGSDPAASSED